MATAVSDAKAHLPPACAHCRALAERVAAATEDAQWDEVVGAHPHAQPDDPRAVCYRRCAACGCCWSISWQFEVGAVYAEQLTEPEYRKRLRSLRYGPPFWDTPAASWLVNGGMFLASVALAGVVVWGTLRADAPLWSGAPWLLLCAVGTFVSGRELVRLVRSR
jgi:hypothetical protein